MMLVLIDKKSQQLHGIFIKRYHGGTKVDSSACAVSLVTLRAALAAMVPDFLPKNGRFLGGHQPPRRIEACDMMNKP
jgi:hypothetical protein